MTFLNVLAQQNDFSVSDMISELMFDSWNILSIM